MTHRGDCCIKMLDDAIKELRKISSFLLDGQITRASKGIEKTLDELDQILYCLDRL